MTDRKQVEQPSDSINRGSNSTSVGQSKCVESVDGSRACALKKIMGGLQTPSYII